MCKGSGPAARAPSTADPHVRNGALSRPTMNLRWVGVWAQSSHMGASGILESPTTAAEHQTENP